MKKIKLILITVVFASNIYAQYTGFSVAAGIGYYQLDDLKQFQDDFIAFSTVDAKGFTYFPPFTHVRLELYRKTTSGLKYGLSYDYSTTGAHANYSDYSGNMNLDQYVKAYQIGAAAYYPLHFRKYFEVLPYGRILVGYTRNLINRTVNTLYDYQYYNVNMHSFSPALEAGAEAIYHFSRYSFGIEAGYQYDVGGTMNIADKDKDRASLFVPDRQVKSNLSGLRAMAKFIIRFNNELLTE